MLILKHLVSGSEMSYGRWIFCVWSHGRKWGGGRCVWLKTFSAHEIERRPRGASRGKSDRRTAAPTFVATCHGLIGHSCQPCWLDEIFRLALLPPHLSLVMHQGEQPWPGWNGALQQMWERACPAKRRAGGARFAHHPKAHAMHLAAITPPSPTAHVTQVTTPSRFLTSLTHWRPAKTRHRDYQEAPAMFRASTT